MATSIPKTHDGHRATEGFLESVAAITAALSEVPCPTALLDDTGTIRWQNRAALDLHGRREGRSVMAFVAPEDADALRSAMARLLTRGGTNDLWIRIETGARGYVSSRGRYIGISGRDGCRVVVAIGLDDAPAEQGSAQTPISLLTRRQRDVLRLLSAGESTAGIARALCVSPATVRNHIASLFAVLGVHSRLEAVAAGRSAGLLGS